MKFYNPFKPHIIKNQLGEYFIRLHTVFGWEYYYKPFDSFVTGSGLILVEECSFSSKEQAQNHMEIYVNRKRYEKLKDKRRNKMKVVK